MQNRGLACRSYQVKRPLRSPAHRTRKSMRFQLLALAAPVPLLLSASLAQAAPLSQGKTASAQGEISELLEMRVGEMQKGDVTELWDAAQKMAYQVGDEYGSDFDKALDLRLESSSIDDGRGKETLFLAAARVYGEDLPTDLLRSALMPLVEQENPELAWGAMNLLPLIGYKDLEEEDRGSMTDRLLDFAESESNSADLRVLAAMTAHDVGLGRQVPRARRVLNGFLKSTDPILRGEGALALAQLGVMGEVPGVQSELEALSNNPGPRGQLAAALLKQESLHTYYENALAKAREERSELIDSGSVGDDLKVLETLIGVVQNYHLEGPLYTREQLLNAAFNGMLNSLDRHSAYFSGDAFKRFEEDLEADYGGIGAYVGIDPEDNLFTITRPLYSGPAYKAGILSDDKIVRIGEWPTIGEKQDDVIKRLKGRPGTEVKLYVWRRGMDPSLIERPTEEMSMTLTRAQITIPPVHHTMLPGKVGLIELTTFSRVASNELKKGIKELLDQGAESIVLDLRNNSGGYLSEARNVADLFLPKGLLVTRTVSKFKEREREWKTLNAPLVPKDMPVAVLINRFSASASEIVSGALQDHGRARLVGQRSYGKGSVQNLLPIPGTKDDEFADENNNRRHDNWETLTTDLNGNGEFDFGPRIKLTIERYLLPTGRSIHRETDKEGNVTSPGGVQPDVEVAPARYDGWKLVEMRRIQDSRKLREYVEEKFPAHKEQFILLANNDMENTDAYPGFDELYNGLGTVLSKQDVRFLLRMEVRRRVQDERGSAFPLGDFESDLQLQAAIKELLNQKGMTLDAEPAFAKTFDEATDPNAPPAILTRAEKLQKALDLLGDEDRALTPEESKTLRELLSSAAGRD